MVTPEVRVEQGKLADVRGGILVAGVWEDDGALDAAARGLDESLDGEVARVAGLADLKGTFKETLVTHPRFPDAGGAGRKAKDAAATRVLLVGLGKRDAFTEDRARQIGARVAKQARDAGAREVRVPVLGADAGDVTDEAAVRALAEGAVLGTYKFDKYRSRNGDDEKHLERFVILTEARDDATRLARVAGEGVIVAEGANRARDWAAYSGEEALAPNLAQEVQAMARGTGLKCQVFDEARIRRLGMNGVLSVNKGSVNEPRFIVLEHGARHKAKGTLALVGKGVTFDTGGISIKPAEKMEDMKFDKSGAAAVWGAMQAIAALDLPVHVVGLTPVVENLPSGSAIKPGDIFTAYNGKTVEVINTDAEGRLILADALAYAEEFAPDAIVDAATLTGAMVVALGNQCTGIMGNDRWILDRLKASAERVNEPVSEFPFFDAYSELLKSKFADVKNVGGRAGGSITAGKFLEHFVPEGVPWVHMDIAGTAWQTGKPGYNDEYSPAVATGVCVRTFVDLARHFDLEGREKRKPTTKKAAARKSAKAGKAAKRTPRKKSARKTAKKTARKKTTRKR